jgi:PhzF family phenazine biosynthesis protein
MPFERSDRQDVFACVKLKGNPVAVFFNAESLFSEDMQAIADWTNLSETTFGLPPTTAGPNYILRIFTRVRSSHSRGIRPLAVVMPRWNRGLPSYEGKIVQECKAGLIELQLSDEDFIQFKLREYKHEMQTRESLFNEIAQTVRATRCDIKNTICIHDGPIWLSIEFKSGEDVFDLIPDHEIIDRVMVSDSR